MTDEKEIVLEEEETIDLIPGAESTHRIPSDVEDPMTINRVFFFAALDYKQRLKLASFSREFQRIATQVNRAMGLKPAKGKDAAEENKRKIEAMSKKEKEAADDIYDHGVMEISFNPEFVEAALGTPGKPVAVMGWQGWVDEDGDAVEFDAEMLLEDLVPSEMIALTMEAYRRSMLGRSTRKKSR